MSTKIDPKENVRFLISCIHHSTNGKPNFDLVAKELNIVSKGAAYVIPSLSLDQPASRLPTLQNLSNHAHSGKRYERLLKSCDVVDSGKCRVPAPAATDDDGNKEPAKPTAKKRKAPAAAATPKVPAVKKAKAAPRAKKAKIETEEEDDHVVGKDIKAEAESDSPLSDFPEELDENVKAEEA
ncbi:hypothetical protein LLEC1_03665 [Akanthomyces lecanii]|uniref:Myb-like DNA-binding domain-containing protein n=1 Tax=Cordyceps confragosa TaxID=2714763 RepID=A0A179IB12_CORDF|nr:hypothetical protein LLEC1_03665 [Akanthomyces lecanii]